MFSNPLWWFYSWTVCLFVWLVVWLIGWGFFGLGFLLLFVVLFFLPWSIRPTKQCHCMWPVHNSFYLWAYKSWNIFFNTSELELAISFWTLHDFNLCPSHKFCSQHSPMNQAYQDLFSSQITQLQVFYCSNSKATKMTGSRGLDSKRSHSQNWSFLFPFPPLPCPPSFLSFLHSVFSSSSTLILILHYWRLNPGSYAAGQTLHLESYIVKTWFQTSLH